MNKPKHVNNLKIVTIPRALHGLNLRTVLSESCWNDLRKKVYSESSFCCEICRARTILHCHEDWKPIPSKKIIKLRSLISVCERCHNVIHFMRSIHFGLMTEDEVACYLSTVNKWEEHKARRYIKGKLDEYVRYSQIVWKGFNLKVLTNFFKSKDVLVMEKKLKELVNAKS